MDKSFSVLLIQLLPILGQEAVTKLASELNALAIPSSGWKKATLALLADAIEKHGAQGIQLATQVVKDIQAGKAPKMDWADLQVASDILAELQNAEADQKATAHEFLETLSHILGVILKGIIAGII